MPPPLLAPDMPLDDDGAYTFHIWPPHAPYSLSRLADGMPPLVDAPPPPMTFTFTTQLPPISYSIGGPNAELPVEDLAPEMGMYSPPGTPMLAPTRTSHAKKRDASYIPRPPNAFILFRSSFIRAQRIPGEIEGNHSALSKIIGASRPPCHADTACLTRFSSPRQVLESAASRGTRSVGSKGDRRAPGAPQEVP